MQAKMAMVAESWTMERSAGTSRSAARVSRSKRAVGWAKARMSALTHWQNRAGAVSTRAPRQTILPTLRTQLRSLPLEHGLALLHEGALRLARVLRVRELDRHALLEAVGVAHRQLLDGVQGALDVADGERALAGDVAGDIERRRHELIARRAGLDHAQPVKLGRRHPAAGQIHQPRTRASDMLHQEARPAGEPDIDLRHGDIGVVGGEHDVASELQQEDRGDRGGR